MMAYTPGPWTEHGKGGCECGMIFGPDHNVLVAIIQGPIHLDDVEGPDSVPSAFFQKGNARLIAAAPDLLESLRALLEAIGGEESTDVWCVDARAAISKAESV